MRGCPPRAARTVKSRRRGGVGVRGADRGSLGVHLVHRDVISAQHVGQCVGGIITGHQQDRVEQLARGVGAASLDAGAVALDVGVGRGGDHGGVQAHLIECSQRQQGLDSARRWVGRVHVPTGQHLAAVEIGDDPGRRRTIRDGRRTDRLNVRIGARRGRGTEPEHADDECDGRRESGHEPSHGRLP